MEGSDSDRIDNARLYVDRAKKKEEAASRGGDERRRRRGRKKKKKKTSHYEISTIRIVLMMKYFSS